MKLIKSMIIVCSAVGVYSALRKYKNKKKPVKQKRINVIKINNYKSLPPAEVKKQFQQRIAAGEWLSEEEYLDMMDAIKNQN